MIDEFDDEELRLMAEKFAARVTVIAGIPGSASEQYGIEFVKTLVKEGWKSGQDFNKRISEYAMAMYEAGKISMEQIQRIQALVSENDLLNLENAELKKKLKDADEKIKHYDKMMGSIGVPPLGGGSVPGVAPGGAVPNRSLSGTTWTTSITSTTKPNIAAATILKQLSKGPNIGRP